MVAGAMIFCLFFSVLCFQYVASQDTCISDPTPDACKTYAPSKAVLDATLDSICLVNALAPVCSLRQLCKKQALATEPVCSPLTLLATACKVENSTQAMCADYQSLCGNPKSIVEACKIQTAMSDIPSTSSAVQSVKAICKEMPSMTGCDKCTNVTAAPANSTSCDVLVTYGKLCTSMPDMSQCGDWKTACKGSLSKVTDVCTESTQSKSMGASETQVVLTFLCGLVVSLAMSLS
jgi:hypothetical protein